MIGVLSAAVLPKFNKVIETRKTTEAEELMASVRTEQEKRCALDKRYLTQMSEMTDIVKNNEPHIALYAKENGIYYYHKIIKNLKNNLPNNYLIAFEIGHTQAKKIEELAIKYLDNPKIIIEKDYSGKDRFIFIINN